MNHSATVELGVAALTGTTLPSGVRLLWRRLRGDPKGQAEARKLNAEAGHTEWGTLRDEIHRLQERVEAQDRRIAELEKLDCERADREGVLKRENRELKAKVTRLEGRIVELEAQVRQHERGGR